MVLQNFLRFLVPVFAGILTDISKDLLAPFVSFFSLGLHYISVHGIVVRSWSGELKLKLNHNQTFHMLFRREISSCKDNEGISWLGWSSLHHKCWLWSSSEKVLVTQFSITVLVYSIQQCCLGILVTLAESVSRHHHTKLITRDFDLRIIKLIDWHSLLMEREKEKKRKKRGTRKK